MVDPFIRRIPSWGSLMHSLGHARLLDTYQQNLLFRMGNPTVYTVGKDDPHVSLPELHDALRRALAGNTADPMQFAAGDGWIPTGKAYPVDAELVDISLLTSSNNEEVKIEAAEESAFGNATDRRLVRWPTWGVSSDTFQKACARHNISASDCPGSRQPRHMPKHAVEALAKNFNTWDADGLAGRVEELHEWLRNAGSRPRVMFFHCWCGCDRTGELAAAYSMRHLDMSLTDALALNEQVASRHMYYDFQVSAQWYCESLRLQGLYRWDDCGNCGPYRCGDTGSPSSPKQQREQNTAVVLAVLMVVVLARACWKCCRRCRQKGKEPDSYLPLNG